MVWLHVLPCKLRVCEELYSPRTPRICTFVLQYLFAFYGLLFVLGLVNFGFAKSFFPLSPIFCTFVFKYLFAFRVCFHVLCLVSVTLSEGFLFHSASLRMCLFVFAIFDLHFSSFRCMSFALSTSHLLRVFLWPSVSLDCGTFCFTLFFTVMQFLESFYSWDSFEFLLIVLIMWLIVQALMWNITYCSSVPSLGLGFVLSFLVAYILPFIDLRLCCIFSPRSNGGLKGCLMP